MKMSMQSYSKLYSTLAEGRVFRRSAWRRERVKGIRDTNKLVGHTVKSYVHNFCINLQQSAGQRW